MAALMRDSPFYKHWAAAVSFDALRTRAALREDDDPSDQLWTQRDELLEDGAINSLMMTRWQTRLILFAVPQTVLTDVQVRVFRQKFQNDGSLDFSKLKPRPVHNVKAYPNYPSLHMLLGSVTKPRQTLIPRQQPLPQTRSTPPTIHQAPRAHATYGRRPGSFSSALLNESNGISSRPGADGFIVNGQRSSSAGSSSHTDGTRPPRSGFASVLSPAKRPASPDKRFCKAARVDFTRQDLADELHIVRESLGAQIQERFQELRSDTIWLADATGQHVSTITDSTRAVMRELRSDVAESRAQTRALIQEALGSDETKAHGREMLREVLQSEQEQARTKARLTEVLESMATRTYLQDIIKGVVKDELAVF